MTVRPEFNNLSNDSGNEHRYQGLSVLVVDDEVGMQNILYRIFSKIFNKVSCASDVEEAELLRKRDHFDIVVLDVNLPGRSGTEWHEVFEDARGAGTCVIFMTGYADLQTTITALKLGAWDFILKPFNAEQMINSVKHCADRILQHRIRYAMKRDISRYVPDTIVGSSDNTRQVVKTIDQFAPSKATVLIEGESGTGKELVARALHEKSGRFGPFVPVNCSTLSKNHLVAELFGQVITEPDGSDSHKLGLFQLANSGTLFLDEVSEVPLELQGALLRVLEERSIKPIGSNRSVYVDIRIIASTNKNLRNEVEQGRFRQDLYYRLNVLQIRLAPLRERKTELAELVSHFTQLFAAEQKQTSLQWSEEDLITMHQYHWPGNIRELKNIIERCILIGKPLAQYWREFNFDMAAQKPPINVTLSHDGGSTAISNLNADTIIGYPDEWTLKEVEKAHIKQVVKSCDGNKSAAAKELGVARKTLERKFKEWDN